VRELLRYGEETAGALMTTNFVAVPLAATASEALKALQGAVQSNTVVYIYVLDPQGVLKGVISIRSLLRATPETKISDIMKPEPLTVPPGMDQEEVTRIVRRYNLDAIPVTDANAGFWGGDRRHDPPVAAEEAGEDLLKMAGAGRSVFADKAASGAVAASAADGASSSVASTSGSRASTPGSPPFIP
jgi:magnesium transporter